MVSVERAYELDKKLLEAYNACELCMNACNAAPVVHCLSSIMKDVLWPYAHEYNLGTEFVNTHPIVICMLVKLGELAGNMQEDSVTKAFDSLRNNMARYKEMKNA